MRVLMGLVALPALVGLAPAAAGAASVSYSQFYPGSNNLDPGLNPQTFSPADWDGTAQGVALPRFNPALGTLTGATLDLYGNIRASGSLTNAGGAAVTIDRYDVATDIALLAPGTPVPWDGSAGILLAVSPVVFSVPPGTVLAGGGSLAFGQGTPVDNQDTASVTLLDDDAAPFVGTGSVAFPLYAATAAASAGNADSLRLSQLTMARAEVTVTYAYDPAATDVPEPASAALLGMGLLGFGLLRWQG